jgi:hypothetical protein
MCHFISCQPSAQIQACFPLLLQFLSIIVLGQAMLQIPTLKLECFTFIAAHWLPVLNPLASILTNRPYREAIFRASGSSNSIAIY